MEWSTVITEVVVEDSSFDDDVEIHVFCDHCDPKGMLAICGTVMTDGEILGVDGSIEPTCVVCADMESDRCPRCGAWP